MRTRLPLQIGIQSLFSLAFAAGTFIPGLLLLLLTGFVLFVKGAFLVLVLLVSQGWIIGLTIVGIEVWLLVMGVRHLRFALRTRPSDVWLDDDGLRVDGGRLHGTVVKWSECRAVREIEDDEDVDIFKPTNLVVDCGRHENVVVGQALDQTELDSLRALREMIQAKLGTSDAAPVGDGRPDLLRCPSCDAPCAPRDADVTPCPFCGASVPVPTALRERVRAMTEVVASSRIAQRLLPKLLDQPTARMTTLLMVAIGLPISLVWILAVAFGFHLWRESAFHSENFGALAIAGVVIVVGSYYLLRFWLVNRMALSVVTAQFGAAVPEKEGAPWRCRCCDGPLTTAGDTLVVRCVWCESDNVLGIDVRPRAEGARREQRTLEAAFERRRADRKRYGINFTVALALVPVAVWLFVRGTGPMSDEARLAVGCAHGDGNACLARAKLLTGDDRRATYERACIGGVEAACIDYANELKYTSDMWRATALLRASCDRQQLRSCMTLGDLVARYGAKDWATPELLYKQACDARVLLSCARYARTLMARHADQEARDVLERACTAKEPSACGELGLVVEDPHRARELLAAACPADPASCLGLGELYWTGRDVPVDHVKAAEYFKTACDVPIGRACTRYGEWVEEVKSASFDVTESWYRAGCGYDDPRGCVLLGKLMKRRYRSQYEAFKVFDNACDRFHDESCVRAGELQWNGANGVRQNLDRAKRLFTVACDAKLGEGCNFLAQMSHDDEDYATSHPLFAKACELGDLNACNWLAFEIDAGQGVTADPAAAQAIYRRTCAVTPATEETAFACDKLPK